MMNISEEPGKTICLALEAAIYVNPDDPRLTAIELTEICERHGFKKGQIADALEKCFSAEVIEQHWNDPKISLSRSYIYFTTWWQNFKSSKPRNLRVIDFILKKFEEEMMSQGKKSAAITIQSLEIETMEALGCSQREFRSSILLVDRYKFLAIDNGVIRYPSSGHFNSKAVERIYENKLYRNDEKQLLDILPTVEDVIARRDEILTTAIDPFDAFAEILPKFDAQNFSTWWRLNVSELNRLDPVRHSTSKVLLSAAMCEAALLLTLNKVKRSEVYPAAQKLSGDPQHWKFSDLAKIASNNEIRIIDDRLRDQLLKLNEDRRRIHAGAHIKTDGVISTVPDISPELPRQATDLLLTVLRKILDWTQTHRFEWNRSPSFPSANKCQ